MRNTIQHYLSKLEVLTSAISDIEQSYEAAHAVPYQCGKLSLLITKKRQCEGALTRLTTFVSHGEFPELNQYLIGVQADTVTSHDHEEPQSDYYVPEELNSDNDVPGEPKSDDGTLKSSHHNALYTSDSEDLNPQSRIEP